MDEIFKSVNTPILSGVGSASASSSEPIPGLLSNPFSRSIDSGLNVVQRGFSTLGLRTPLERAVALGVLSSSALWISRPALFFYPDGSPREFGALGFGPAHGTPLPWWSVVALAAFLGAGF